MVVKNNQFSWEDHNCEDPEVSHHPVAPICQQETTISQTTTMGTTLTSTPPLQCPDDYAQFQGHCYKFYGSSYYWTTADAYCLGYGGRLASVHSSEEDDFIRDLAGGNSYWMGGYPSGNTWVWSDGTEYDYVGNVYDMDTGECIAFRNGYGWYTYSCTSDSLYYVCKIWMDFALKSHPNLLLIIKTKGMDNFAWWSYLHIDKVNRQFCLSKVLKSKI